MTTKQYTAEDFANTEFARRPDGDIAARFARFDYLANTPWRVTNGLWLSDAEMADGDWVPVREARPITFDALRDAWANAEDVDECNKGDVLIYWHPSLRSDRVEVWVAEWPGPLGRHARILHRAPKPKQPEGAEVLGALLDEWVSLPRGEEPTPSLADWLAARGVRVTEVEGDGVPTEPRKCPADSVPFWSRL